jgi:Dolichyl-phosphate-mannose-protein mannosyltransferase
MQALSLVESGTDKTLRTEVWFRRILILFATVAVLAILSQLGLLIWAQNSFAGGEAVVAAHSMMLVHDGTLYYDFNHYPYTVAPYTPLFYLLDAGLQQTGLSAYTAGRLISFLALLGIVVLSWYIVLVYTNDRYSASMSTLLCASSALLLYWGTVGQVDVLAVFWGMGAFYLYSRYVILRENTLIWAGVCAVLAFFTKQTMLACPAAICLALWFTNRKAAVRFGFGCLAAVAIIVFSLNAVLGGRFLADTFRANLNPYSSQKLLLHLRFAMLTAGPLVIVAAFGTRKAFESAAPPRLYTSAWLRWHFSLVRRRSVQTSTTSSNSPSSWFFARA